MNSDLIILGGGAAFYVAWKLEKRRRAVSLNWPRGLVPVKIAERCQTFLKNHGITSYVLFPHVDFGNSHGDGDFNLRIPNEQFGKTVGVFKVLCRDNIYIVGEMFFKDAAAKLKLGNDIVATVIALVTDPPDTRQRAWADMWGVAIIHTPELREFVAALEQAKAGLPVEYKGRSMVLREAFAKKIEKAEVARGHEELALEAERRGDWASAEKHWRDCIEKRADRWQSFLSLSKCVGAQGRAAEAGQILYDAWARFPLQPEVAPFAADYAHASGDWAEAFRIWKEVMLRFPKSWIGFHGQVATLQKMGRQAEADAFLEAEAPRFPLDAVAQFEFAQLAERRLDWRRAEETWRALIALPESRSWHTLRLYQALRAQGRVGEATEVLLDAGIRFPEDEGIAREIAKCGLASAAETRLTALQH